MTNSNDFVTCRSHLPALTSSSFTIDDETI